MSVCPSALFSTQLALGRSSPATKSRFMGMGHLRGAGRGAQGKPGHSPAMTTRAAGLPGRRNGPSDTKPSPSPGSTVPFRQQGWDQLSPAPGPCAKETVQGKQESGAMPRERKAAPSLLASPAALPPQRALSHPPPYLLSAFPTEGVKPTVVCSTPVETKAPTSSVVQKRRVTPAVCHASPQTLCLPLSRRVPGKDMALQDTEHPSHRCRWLGGL